MKATILKRMVLTGGTVVNSGDIVDVSGWRNAKALVLSRYIKLVEEDAPARDEVIKTTPTPKAEKTAKPKKAVSQK